MQPLPTMKLAAVENDKTVPGRNYNLAPVSPSLLPVSADASTTPSYPSIDRRTCLCALFCSASRCQKFRVISRTCWGEVTSHERNSAPAGQEPPSTHVLRNSLKLDAQENMGHKCRHRLAGASQPRTHVARIIAGACRMRVTVSNQILQRPFLPSRYKRGHISKTSLAKKECRIT